MIFRPFYYFDRGCAAYLFGCGTLGRCTVVDARADDVDTYVTFAASKNMRITHVIDTHVHADHLSGGPKLSREAPSPSSVDGILCSPGTSRGSSTPWLKFLQSPSIWRRSWPSIVVITR